jgi:hypothetical protein
MDLAIIFGAQSSSKVSFHSNIIFSLRLAMCCCDIIFRFRLHQAGVQLGGKVCWTSVLQVLSDKVICDRSGETHVSRNPVTRRRPIQYYMSVVRTGMSNIEFLASTIFAVHGQLCRTCHDRSRRQGVNASRFHIR